jgi:hypothetical protein
MTVVMIARLQGAKQGAVACTLTAKMSSSSAKSSTSSSSSSPSSPSPSSPSQTSQSPPPTEGSCELVAAASGTDSKPILAFFDFFDFTFVTSPLLAAAAAFKGAFFPTLFTLGSAFGRAGEELAFLPMPVGDFAFNFFVDFFF